MIDFLMAVPGKLTTIYSHLTTYMSSTRMPKIDNLDAAISTRAAAATAVSSANWTTARAGYLEKLNATAGILGTIKSVQYGTVTANSGSASGTATITAVNTAKAMLFFLGAENTAADSPTMLRLGLTNSTTVTGYKRTGADATKAGFMVVEFY